MTLEDIYLLGLKMAIAADPRGKAGVEKYLARIKKEYEELPEKQKKYFDKENLVNPYVDSRILLGNRNKVIKKILVGIDIYTGEVVLADRLGGVDLLISHHPEGESWSALHEVMDLNVDILGSYGVPVNVAEHLLGERMGEVRRRISPANHQQNVDAARLLGFAMMCAHTFTDNLVYDFLKKLFEKEKPETVGEVVDLLMTIPEYQEATRGKAGPMIFVGDAKKRAGKVAPIEITGGTEGSPQIYEKLAQAGVGTIVGMHASEEHRKESEKYHVNMVVAGHISSDSLGMNLFLDEIERQGVQIVPCSGLIRVKRNSK
ncbi:NGG1p interacting factor NIF3 [Patescibacteria group bacterium]|nr:NGG1p interacting factor NIF3 [Patescibacteria group bacterium]